MQAAFDSNMATQTVKLNLTYDELDTIRYELLKLTFQQIPIFSFSTMIILLGTFFIFLGKVHELTLIIWSSLTFFTLLISSFYIYKARKSTIDSTNFHYWKSRLNTIGLIRGMLWGSIAIIFYKPEQTELQVFLFVILLVIATLMAFISAAEKSVFFAVTIPVLAPIAFQFALNGDDLHATFSLSVLFYFIVLLSFYLKSHNTLRETLRHRFEVTELAEQLEIQKNEAEQANKDKSRFLASASHDLRQPIHAQTLLIEELSERNDDVKLSNLIRDIKISTTALHGLFDALLDISKLDSGTVEPLIEIFSLRELLDTIGLEYNSIAKTKQLNLRVMAPDVNIQSDRNLLSRIIHNLVSNALKHTTEGSVLIAARKRGNHIRIEVRDSGIGIPDEEKSEIFKEYYQITTADHNKSQGLGLGLSIVQRLSRLLNHPLELISQYGQGSVFAVTVPVTKTKPLTDTSRLRLKCELKGISDNHVLVIDDDAMIRRSMYSLLSHWGFTVTTAESGNEACELLTPETLAPDIIIADYRLKDNETGIQAIKLVNGSLKKPAPALIVTGDTAEYRMKQIKSHGYKVLHKPVAPAKLRSLIRFLIDENNFDLEVISAMTNTIN
ncbi:MAG: hybrid sensor histidine kinase/response regulator [Gammaproteobacteria bacterium]